LNASGRSGDARIATRLLRQAGIDVVYFGNATESGLDSTRIVVRRGTAAVGEKVRKALGGRGRVEVQLEGSKLLDVSVLLGADFLDPPPHRAPGRADVRAAAAPQPRLHTPIFQPPLERQHLRPGAGREIRRAARMERNEVYQRLQRLCELRELVGRLERIVL